MAGEAIPIGARVVAVVDAFDAMVHERPYRAARTPREAIEEIRRCAGSRFDPAITRRFLVEVALDQIGRRGVARLDH